jgi:hypothetical protein
VPHGETAQTGEEELPEEPQRSLTTQAEDHFRKELPQTIAPMSGNQFT